MYVCNNYYSEKGKLNIMNAYVIRGPRAYCKLRQNPNAVTM